MQRLPPDVIDLIVRHLDRSTDRRNFLCALERPWTVRNIQDVAVAQLRDRNAHLLRLTKRRPSRCVVCGCDNARISFLAWLRPRVMTRGLFYCAHHVDPELLASAELYATDEDRLEIWN